jgi:hypothetical protein
LRYVADTYSDSCGGLQVGVGEVWKVPEALRAWFNEQGDAVVRDLPHGEQVIELYTALGQRLLHVQFRSTGSGIQTIPTSALAPGAYMLALNGTRASVLVKQP